MQTIIMNCLSIYYGSIFDQLLWVFFIFFFIQVYLSIFFKLMWSLNGCICLWSCCCPNREQKIWKGKEGISTLLAISRPRFYCVQRFLPGAAANRELQHDLHCISQCSHQSDLARALSRLSVWLMSHMLSSLGGKQTNNGSYCRFRLK